MDTITLDLSADIIDVRDIIARVEELETHVYDAPDEDAICELQNLQKILADLVGYGGDEQWRGDWYPVTLVRDSYFTTYAREMLEDIDFNPGGLPHYVVIDWQATARNIREDYTPVEIDGTTYWYR